MKECHNCGMPMIKNEDFGNGDPKSVLCRHCLIEKKKDDPVISKEDADKRGTANKLPSLQDMNDDELFKI